ncbi:MAG: GNAT family N-acetyltransferase [Lentisphaerae bacterium]|nr:GNAT family N-acetyltransferase [Lentisphaerota bacterium]
MIVEPLQSRNVRLRTATDDDAAFMLELRTDESLSRFLNRTDADLGKQKAWIAAKRDAADDLPLIIEDAAGLAVGTVSIYHIDAALKSFCWGRWIIRPGSMVTAAIESALLVYVQAFEKLGLELCVFDVRNGNAKVLSFHEKLGAHFMYRTSTDSWFFFSKDDFAAARSRYARFL